jgi:hypothetical protein
MILVNYIAHAMPLAYAAYQAGFYNISPRGIMPYLTARYGIEFPGFM